MKNTINKIILFAAFFAAGFTTSANAQVTTPASARVFSDIGMQSLVDSDGGASRAFNFNDSIQQVFRDIGIATAHQRSFACIRTSDGGLVAVASATNNLPIFRNICTGYNNNTPNPGDIFILRDSYIVGNPIDFRISVRTYRKAGNNDLFMARGEGDLLPTPAAPTTSSQADKTATQFFLIESNWERTDTLTRDAFGFQPVQCATGYISDDETTCRLLQASDCQNTEFLNEANTPSTCDLRTPANNDCIGIQTVVNNLCVEPSCDTTTTQLNNGNCDCLTGFSARVNPTMCERNASDCASMEATPILGDDGMCRAAGEMGECPAAFPIFDDMDSAAIATGNCRLPTIADGDAECFSVYGVAMPIFDDSETDKCRPLVTSDCEGEQTAENGVCVNPVCGETESLNDADKICEPRTAEDCDNMQVFEPANSGGICVSAAEVLAGAAFISATYTADSCENARWQTGFAFSENRQEVAEICGIPLERNDSAVAAARESQPQIAENGDTANGCAMRRTAAADSFAVPDCADLQVFGSEGFPAMPDGFDVETDRLIVVVVAGGENRIFYGDLEVPRLLLVVESSGDAQESAKVAGVVGGILGMVAIVHYFHSGDVRAFSFSPDAGYAFSESGYSAHFGGRAKYEIGEWDLYWSAGQTNTDGKFGDLHYESGAKFNGEIWTAAFSESIAGKTADYDLSLSADLRGGVWSLSPVYRMHSEWKESDFGIQTETQNELNLEGEFRYNNWQIRPSAGFRWENAADFAEGGRFQINAVHRF